MMNITDKDGRWKLESGFITNLKTNEVRTLKHTPSVNAVAHMSYGTYMRKCKIAFNTGTWPVTNWKSGRITD